MLRDQHFLSPVWQHFRERHPKIKSASLRFEFIRLVPPPPPRLLTLICLPCLVSFCPLVISSSGIYLQLLRAEHFHFLVAFRISILMSYRCGQFGPHPETSSQVRPLADTFWVFESWHLQKDAYLRNYLFRVTMSEGWASVLLRVGWHSCF